MGKYFFLGVYKFRGFDGFRVVGIVFFVEFYWFFFYVVFYGDIGIIIYFF